MQLMLGHVRAHSRKIKARRGRARRRLIAESLEDRNLLAANPVLTLDNPSVTIDESQTATNSGTFSDADVGDSVIVSASIGTITQDTGNNGNWSWSFDPFDGPEDSQTVTITADDGQGGIANVMFPLTVDNLQPTLGLAAFNTPEGSPLTLIVQSVNDPGDDTLTEFVIDWGDGSPLETFTDTNGWVHTYADGPSSPLILVSGTDEDGTYPVIGALAPVILNADPTAATDNASVGEDGPAITIDVLANDSDPAGALDTITVTGFDATGVLGIVSDNGDGTFDYDPNGQFNSLSVGQSATETFTYDISDGEGGSDTGTVTITVNGVNDGPPVVTVTNASVAVDEGFAVTNDGTFSDVDAGDNVTISASVGTITQDTGNSGNWNWSYVPVDGPDDSQTVTITADDGEGGIANVTFSLTVDNLQPTLGLAAANTPEGSPLTLIVQSVNDPGDDTLTEFVVDWGDGSPLETFTDTNGWVHTYADGPSSPLILVSGTDEDGTYPVIGALAPVILNADPTAATDNASVGEDGPAITIDVLANDSDPAGALDTITVTGFDATGVLGIVSDNGDGTFDYDPNGQFNSLSVGQSATETFTYDISDGEGGSDTGTVTITVNGINDAPTVNGATFSVDENSALGTGVGTVTASDPDAADTLDFSITAGNTGAAFAIDTASGEITVSNPAAVDFETTPVFALTVEVDDGTTTDSATVIINVNDLPEGGPVQLINGVLIVTGTPTANDVVILNNGDGTVTVTFDGLPPQTFAFADIDEIVADLGDGDDSILITGFTIPITIDGGAGDDDLDGSNGDDTLIGGPGNDRLDGDGGDDLMEGGADDDVITGGSGNDFIKGGSGNDLLFGEEGADVLRGGGGSDFLVGGSGFDLLIGGNGIDLLRGGNGGDLIIGGRSSASDANLDLVLAEWGSPRSYAERTSNILSGGGPILGGFALVPGVNVLDDNSTDFLRGGNGRDWFFAELDGMDGDDDLLLDLGGSEDIVLLF